ncbi:hypothetical protein G4Y79_13415 [Phototrophicus methaneseepsis]|uniref:Uncharacterized protein n=1 Tax=Phototrophicus methaneseepsis TaxID=2710758 RepID=A0A7S8E5H5_9CHLR|nr:hypothetical protein [Phototrophicus methaneseepsis]QPC80710.1 hypothetical protein G4Y79_13415 [Phototrophicus methaneseepsis]
MQSVQVDRTEPLLYTALKRHMLALFGASVAMALHIYLSFDNQGWLALARIGTALGHGLLFGHVVALLVTGLLVMIPRIQFIVLRICAACLWGVAFGTLAWWVHVGLLLQQPTPDFGVLLIGGVALSAGFILCGLRKLPFWLRMLITAGPLFVVIVVTYQNYFATLAQPSPETALLYFRPDYPNMVWWVGGIFSLLIAFFGTVGWGRRSF